MQFPKRRTAAIAIVSFAVACTTAVVFAAPAKQAATLTTDKDKVSYAIGMQMAASLQEVKGDIDPAVLSRAIATSLAGGKTAMTVPEAKTVLQAFGQKVQARQAAAQQAQAQTNTSQGDAFLATNAKKPGVKTTASGLEYQVLRAGTGAKPKATDKVKVNYVGTTLDGKTFDSSYDRGQPVVLSLDGVIPGWTEGLQLMTVGSKYAFWVPGKLAYGAKGTPGGPIGPNATLHFEIELLSIEK